MKTNTKQTENLAECSNKSKPMLQDVFSLSLDDLEGEIWVDAIGFDGIYEVSSFGRIKSLGRWVSNGKSERWVKEKIRKQVQSQDGRLTCPFSVSNKKYSINVSGLIYFSFNPSKNYLSSKYCVSHKNKIPNDNRLENLILNKVSDSCKINWEKGLLPHLSELHKKVVNEYNLLTERKCKVCEKTKPINKFKRGCKKCLKCEYLHRSKPNYRQTNEIKIKCLSNSQILTFKNAIELQESKIISRPTFRNLLKSNNKTFKSFKTKLEYAIISVS